MSKKIKTILLLGALVAIFFLKKPEYSVHKFLNRLVILSNPEVIELASALAERPYDKELQNKFLIDLKGREKLPKFEDFPAAEFSNNKNIVIDIHSDPIGQEFRTAIRRSVKTVGINFAGKYSIAEWGCGTTCSNGAIVDADTGHIYPLPEMMANGFDSRKNSRLLIQNPIIIGGDWPRPWYLMRYWEWTGKTFRSLGTYKVDLAKKEIIEVGD